MCVKEDVIGLLRECSQCNDDLCDACKRLGDRYEDLRGRLMKFTELGEAP
jgi:hypothetical protein